ncbi:MAG: penicillin-binding protein 2 [Caloramator sp.]|jgi:peptidoglycan glycosyltransferase|uniref:peptidoglycan D,D-transpeptidase FtsI family protein n=1 Tax=Caloramator sp. TaxID=1871330 RepID=UPI001D7A81A4|nr:penicillin-binding transpeptidase domain-containing protein [Caloramator sp.]MBZ4662466.1 penicillin-binding protein 2 [Caloramator sp.]
MKDREENIKKVIVFFVLCFLSIITYLIYFNLYTADKIKYDSSNKRVIEEEKNTIRGMILDRYGEILAETDKKGERKYPFGSSFGNVTGYISYKFGKAGVEAFYNNILLGREQFLGDFVDVFGSLRQSVLGQKKKGDNVVLTIDSKLQNKIYNSFRNDKGAAVCINPKTGEILAMVSKPSINPNKIDENFNEYSNDNIGKPFLNRAIQEYYPPGSVFKIVTTAAALENIEGIDSYINNCNGILKVGDKIIKDYREEKHGKVDIKNAFKVSCNNTFAKLGLKLGYDVLKNEAEKFLFNKEIYIKDDFAKIKIKPALYEFNERDEFSVGISAIGQHEVKANPMTMALMTCAVANEGKIMQPYILDSIVNYKGNLKYKTKPEKLADAIDLKTAETIKNYMILTVKEGTAKKARNSIPIAAKTGTAENAIGKEAHSWFVAFAPANNPQIVIAVVVENAGAGSGRALDIAKEAISHYLNR